MIRAQSQEFRVGRNPLVEATYALPAHWACYLINGDDTGLEPAEKSQVDAFLGQHKLPRPVSCSDESYFTRYNDANTGRAGDVLDYSFLVQQ